ncbi:MULTISPECIES: response regulator [unclassified Lysobacter]|uniref:response regulator n=1 Tax=unclassified Lysobacter TaxID=2635362 RepID=UPI001C239293|nr:response regulator [Lysobacter sp. MMG2]MBU8975185.1 response regulator [Lysobacter sp. MMG2]
MKANVLMVEDEAYLAMALEDLLTDAGYHVLGAARLSDALEIADHEHLDVALLDINVQGEAVYPLASRLREQGVPFVFASAYSERNIPQDFRDCQIVQKPYTSERIIEAVESMLEGGKAQAH